jgi:hypothetical protein
VRPEVVMVATSDNDSDPLDEVCGQPRHQPSARRREVVGFRDHAFEKENDGWYTIVGTGIKGESGGRRCSTPPTCASGAISIRFAGVKEKMSPACKAICGNVRTSFRSSAGTR